MRFRSWMMVNTGNSKVSLIEATLICVRIWKEKLGKKTRMVKLEVEQNEHGQPVHRGSGKDLSYFDDQSRERFVPHVIEPSAGADRATLAFICEAYHEDSQPDEHGKPQERTLMKFHPRPGTSESKPSFH